MRILGFGYGSPADPPRVRLSEYQPRATRGPSGVI